MDYKYDSIVLSKRDVSEVDRIYAVYTCESGKVRLMAKGVRKAAAKLAGGLESVTHSEIFVAKSKGIGKITSVIPIDFFRGLKSNFEILKEVLYALRIFERLISDQEQDRRIFDLTLDYLKACERLSEEKRGQVEMKSSILTLGFLFKLLDEMGYRIEVAKCVSCSQVLYPQNNYFSASQGGIICPNCYGKSKKGIRINDQSIKLLRIFLKNEMKNLVKLSLENKDLRNARMILDDLLRWISL